jgi:hypothetical protein
MNLVRRLRQFAGLSQAEFAQFCAVFVDGTSRFQTGQVIGFDGGWSAS